MNRRRGPGRCGQWLLGILLIGVLSLAGLAQAGESLRIDHELQMLRDGKATAHLAGARYRFAVFTYEDPDGTGLGDALATVLSHELLMNGQVEKRGVLRYLGDLGRAADERQLRYFDKVEPLIESQRVQVALWGVIRRVDHGLQVDSYVQLSPAALRQAFSFTLRLAYAIRLSRDARLPYGLKIGDARLIHRVGPDRMLAQRLLLDADAAGALSAIAKGMDRLQAAPADSAKVVGTLPLDTVYHLVDRQGEWLKVAAGGKTGWLRRSGLCTGSCAPLLDVARFASGLMAYDERGEIPQRPDTLADDAKVVIDQLIALKAMIAGSKSRAVEDTIEPLRLWCPTSPIAEARPSAPGGAATCNLSVLADAMASARGGNVIPFGRVRALTNKAFIQSLSQRLALASMGDPRHEPTLKNLSILFTILGDSPRAELAAKLAEEARGQGNSP